MIVIISVVCRHHGVTTQNKSTLRWTQNVPHEMHDITVVIMQITFLASWNFTKMARGTKYFNAKQKR
jgi:hypothetical protein